MIITDKVFKSILTSAFEDTLKKGLTCDNDLMEMFDKKERIQIEVEYSTVGALFGLNLIENITTSMIKYVEKNKEENND